MKNLAQRDREDLESLNLIVFQNYETRNDILTVMRIAYEQAKETKYGPVCFDNWLSMKKIEIEEQV